MCLGIKGITWKQFLETTYVTAKLFFNLSFLSCQNMMCSHQLSLSYLLLLQIYPWGNSQWDVLMCPISMHGQWVQHLLDTCVAYILDQQSTHQNLLAKFRPLLTILNKIWWKHSCIHMFMGLYFSVASVLQQRGIKYFNKDNMTWKI